MTSARQRATSPDAGQASPRPAESIGIALRALRHAASLEQPELAELIGTSQSKVSRMERGLHRFDPDVIAAWFEHTNAGTADREAILALLQAAQREVRGYRSVSKGGIFSAQGQALTQDLVARAIRHYQPMRIPGPLQDANYARAVLTSTATAQESVINEAVAARLARGDRIAAGQGPSYHLIMHELAIRWRPTQLSEDQRRAAWRRVATLGRSPHIVLQILTADTPTSRLPNCGFMITEFADPSEPVLVQVELPSMEISFRDDTDVDAYNLDWKMLADAALSPAESLRLVRGLSRGQ